MTESEIKEFIERVARLRELQKAYFKSRGSDELRACRKIETEIDAVIKKMRDKTNEHPRLFT